MLYKDLDLKKIREDNDLDFAHYTFGRGQCSCCYGPYDMPARYWRNGVKPSEYLEGTETYNDKGEVNGGKPREITYILFKNACNGSGTVRAADEIEDYTCICYKVKSAEQLFAICADLQAQLGESYAVKVPNDFSTCIIIYTKDSYRLKEEEGSRGTN